MPKLDRPVPVFPLPNLVLFPHAVQFLHIFEERYQKMVADELQREPGDRLIGMAVLQPGYEEKYYTNHATVYPVLCVSLVVHSERLDDGRYHLMVRGLCRAEVQQDLRDGAYRCALLEGLVDNDGQTLSTEAQRLRQAVRQAILGPAFDELPDVRRYRRMVESDLPLGHVTDLLAFHLLPSNTMQVKRLMLEQLDVVERARLVLTELHTLEKALERIATRRENWPPRECAN